MNEGVLQLVAYVEWGEEVRYFNLGFYDSKFDIIYVSGEHFDDIESWDEFTEEFGNEYYDSLEDYKKDNVKLFSDWIKDNNLDTGSSKDE
jgi:hypothetical protein